MVEKFSNLPRRLFLKTLGKGAMTGSLISASGIVGSAMARSAYAENTSNDNTSREQPDMQDTRPKPTGPDPSEQQILANLTHANEVAKASVTAGSHPFGAILVAADHTTVLMEQGNIDTVNHAESTLARLAAEKYSEQELWGMTLYTTVEPCVMCAGTQYWANIGRLIYGMSERQLLDLTGAHAENPTLDVPCRYVFEHSQKNISVWGPVEGALEEIAELHKDFWG